MSLPEGSAQRAAAAVCGEWTDAKMNRAQAVFIMQRPPFADASFLVDRMVGYGDGPPRKRVLGVYQGRVLARMLQDDLSNWYGVIRYVVVNETVL